MGFPGPKGNDVSPALVSSVLSALGLVLSLWEQGVAKILSPPQRRATLKITVPGRRELKCHFGQVLGTEWKSSYRK